MTAPAAPRASRIDSIDFVRGLVMVLMAIDHVRVYAGVPAGGPTYGIFFTRWVTHFCAPAFVFFAGTAAFLHGRKLGDSAALTKYLVSRGLLLVVLELTLIRFTWTFNFDYAQFTLAGVIWMLGWCMILLGALVRLPVVAVGVLGLVIVFAQQLFGLIGGALPPSIGTWYAFVYSSSARGPITVLYTLVPWIGVMAAGYGFGAIMSLDAARRRALCLRIGVGATAVFLVAALVIAGLQNVPENAPPLFLRALAQQKYPASQLFLLMTLGPAIALLPFVESVRGWFGRMLVTFGRVPMFYYLLHIPLIHVLAIIVMNARGAFDSAWYATAPYASVPPTQQWSLPLLYAVFVAAVALLYFPCRWYAGVKSRGSGGLTSYI